MHALFNSIHSVNDRKPFGGSLQAALSDRSYQPIALLMASTGLHDTLVSAGKLTVAQIDKALSGYNNLSSIQRIQLKSTLDRLGLLN